MGQKLDENIYDVALRLTDETLGWGMYAFMARGYDHPEVQAALARWRDSHVLSKPHRVSAPNAPRTVWEVCCSCGAYIARSTKSPETATNGGEMHRAGAFGP